MIILVDGPDGAGKTTLCKQIHEAIPHSTLRHFGAPATPDEADNYWKAYAHHINTCSRDGVAIFDRSWFSDLVYGPIMRNKQEMSYEHADMLSAMVIATGGGMVIYCTAPVKTMWSRCKKRGETYIPDIQTLMRISQKYDEVMKDRVKYMPVIRYDTAR